MYIPRWGTLWNFFTNPYGTVTEENKMFENMREKNGIAERLQEPWKQD